MFRHEDLHRRAVNNEAQMVQRVDNMQDHLEVDWAEMDRQEMLQMQQRQQSNRVNYVEQRILHEERIKTLKFMLTESRFPIHVPKKVSLSEEIGKTFKSRVSEKVRLEKQRNKRSRLHQKLLNFEKLENIEQRVEDESFEQLDKYLEEDQVLCQPKELSDLAAFMTKEDENVSKNILDNYLGKGEQQKGIDRNKALDFCLLKLTSFDLGKIDLTNDKILADNAQTLQRVSMQLRAFDRLAAKNAYFAGMDEDTQHSIEDKLQQLRSVVAYYELRKEIITDPLYMSHYNDELTMDFTSTTDEAQKALAKKLLKAHLAGIDMLEKNGANDKLLLRLRLKTPRFRDPSAGNTVVQNTAHMLRTGLVDYELKVKSDKQMPSEHAKKFYRENKQMAKMFVETAEKNALSFKGSIEQQKDYKDEGYKPEKVFSYFEELKAIKADDFKCDSYRDMLSNFAGNYSLCDKVHHLHFLIMRALTAGWKDERIGDDDLMELRVKANFFNNAKLTMEAMNYALIEDEKTALYSDEEWDNFVTSRVRLVQHQSTFRAPVIPGKKADLLKEIRDFMKEEEDTKEETIKETYKYIMEPGSDEPISEEELKKRKEQFTKNAVVTDYLTDNELKTGGSIEGSLDLLFEKKGKFVGRKSPKLPRYFGYMGKGKSAKEIERLYDLATGSDEQQLQYYCEILANIRSVPMEKFDMDDPGTFFDDWQKKTRVGKITADGLHDVLKEIKTILLRNRKIRQDDIDKGKEPTVKELKFPEPYTSFEEMERDLKALYVLGQDVIGPRTTGISQAGSAKWLHPLSVFELGTYDIRKAKAAEKASGDIGDDIVKNNAFSKLRSTLDFCASGITYAKPGQTSFDVKTSDCYEMALKKNDKEKKKLLDIQQKASERSKEGSVVSNVSDKTWKESGGATFKKIMEKSDADRIEQKSKGFLAAVSMQGEDGKVYKELRPSLPKIINIKGTKVELRKTWNLFIKSYVSLITNENGSFKTESITKDICEKFSAITMYYGNGYSKEDCESYLKETFGPVMRKILQDDDPDIKPERLDKQVDDITKGIILLVENVEGKQLLRTEVDPAGVINSYKLLANLSDSKLVEYLRRFKIKDKGKERNPTEEEINSAIQGLKDDLNKIPESLKEVRDLDIDSETVPVFNACSGNAEFYRKLQTLHTKEKANIISYKTEEFVKKKPREALGYLRNELNTLGKARGLNDEKIEQFAKTLNEISAKDKIKGDDIDELITISNRLANYEYHVGAHVVSDEEDGDITIEAFAAEDCQFEVTPITMHAAIGQYHGPKKALGEGKEKSHTGFSNYYNTEAPYTTNVVNQLKTYLNMSIKKYRGQLPDPANK